MRKKIWIGVLIVGIILTGRFAFASFASDTTLKLKGDNPIYVEAGEPFDDPGATATLDGKDVSDKIRISGEVDTSKEGTYDYSYTYRYLAKSISKKRTVIVQDTKGPEIKLKEGNKITISSADSYKEPGFTATDATDGDCTDSVKVTEKKEKDSIKITYSATDSKGNKSEVVRTVIIKDETKPTIELIGDSHITLGKGQSFKEPGVKAIDDTDGDISSKVKSEGYIDMFKAGDYEITYTASDKAGNKASVKRTVTVTKAAVTNPVYLTFDDGPSTKVTPQILKTLKKNNVNATFFILNYGDSKEKIKTLKKMRDDGNTIGIHSYSHEWGVVYKNKNVYIDGLKTMNKMINKDLNYSPFAVRFPGGSGNSVSRHYCKGVMTSLTKSVPKAGYTYFDWNVYDGDSDGPVASKAAIVRNVTKNLRKGRNNIVLMHDINSKQTTADALQSIITWGKKHGYTFYPITAQTRPYQAPRVRN